MRWRAQKLMRVVRAGMSCALGAAALAAADAHARSVTAIHGGPGGAPFVQECAPGEYVTGFRGRSNAAVDSIGLFCSGWDVSAQVFVDPRAAGPLYGGNGGLWTNEECPNNAAIRSLTAQTADNRWRSLGFVRLFCTRRDGANVTPSFGNDFGQFAHSGAVVDRFLECPQGEMAIGIQGRHGVYVDAIGLICGPGPAAAPPLIILPPLGGAAAPRCLSGYVWREARPGDVVCVTPESRARVRQENATAPSRVNPNGPYGPNTCVTGFVWRDAFQGDVVCVTPEVRALVRQENAAAASRTAH